MKEDLALLRTAATLIRIRIVRILVGVWRSSREDLAQIRNGVVLYLIVGSGAVGAGLAIGLAIGLGVSAFHWASGLGG